ncbi:MAG TPA: type VI secretion system baseplate subunit TssK [Gammaproteobacteria bacterium]|nr:type VI secretion system baseplate subunit TssK [Gammaproteobacteria bacterium]
MTLSDKVIWSEGMFLHPHHLQQQERYFDNQRVEHTHMINPYAWGITELKLDEELLPLGKLTLKSCKGILPDGTLFNIPARDRAPLSIDIPLGTSNSIIYLALPLKRAGVYEASPMLEEDKTNYRYHVDTIEVSDSNAGSEVITPLQIGKLSLRLLREDQDRQGFSCLGLARILEVRKDHKILLDEHYLPTCLNVHAVPNFSEFIDEIQGLVHYRGNMLMERLLQGNSGGVAEIADFMLLQIMNRYEPLLQHFSNLQSLHPEKLYHTLVQLVGEISTFTHWQRRPAVMENYLHDDLQTIFQPIISEIRRSLSLVLEEGAVALKIEAQEPNLWVSILSDKSLLDKANLVLAVSANIPQENLRLQFPAQVKVAPVEEIRSLVNRALPGIELSILPVAPRQIPYYANFAYFTLNHRHVFWEQLKKSAGLAFHVGGDFPGLHLELWAVKDKPLSMDKRYE